MTQALHMDLTGTQDNKELVVCVVLMHLAQ